MTSRQTFPLVKSYIDSIPAFPVTVTKVLAIFEYLSKPSNIALDFLQNFTDEVNLEIEKAHIFLQIAG